MAHLIYNQSAATKITGRLVINVRIWANVIFVEFQTGSPRFVSKKAFKAEFVRSRQARGQQIFESGLVEPVGYSSYLVKSPTSFDTHKVILEDDHITCTCSDWDKQSKAAFNTPTCKHGYAALATLGYSRLSQYLKATKISA
jgi:hypothetical protein